MTVDYMFTQVGPSMEWIAGEAERRRIEQRSEKSAIEMVRNAYNGKLTIPLPELDTMEKSYVANLIVSGIDQTAQRISSVMPAVSYPPLREGFQGSEEKARKRTLANQSWWKENHLPQKMRRRAKWFVGYGSAPAMIEPDYARGIPQWNIFDPYGCYPSATQNPDDVTPDDCIFFFKKSWQWLKNANGGRYRPALARLMGQTGMNNEPRGALQVDLVRYVDAEVTVLGLLGSSQWGDQWAPLDPYQWGCFQELERLPNHTGICPVVIPKRITLDRPKGQFDDAIGPYEMQARLMALEVIAVERGVFPDTYLVSRQNETAQFIAGPYDGRSGQVNVVRGGDIKEANLNPGFATTGTIDRLERATRINGGMPSEYQGESSTNIRTGRRGDAVMAGVVQFPVQEAQETFALALEEENRRAVSVMKSCFGSRKSSFYVKVGNRPGKTVDYVANDIFENDTNTVTYPQAGVDQNGLTVQVGQLVGMGLMSKETAGENLPLIADPMAENRRVTAEGLEAAVLATLQAKAQSGEISLPDMGRIADLVVTGKKTLVEAIAQVQQEAQERQANSGEAGTPTGPALPGSPEAMPGLAAPGQGQETPTVAPPPQGAQNLGQLLQILRG